MKKTRTRVHQPLLIQSYSGHVLRASTPTDLKSVPQKERPGLSVATYSRPHVAEGHEVFTREKIISEIPEALSAASCLFPIHDAGNFARWIRPDDAKKLSALDARIDELQAKRKRLTVAAFGRGQPITPDEVRKL